MSECFYYQVPIIKEGNYSKPRVPNNIGFIVEEYKEDVVLIKVSKGGHNYLKKTTYAKRVR